MTKNKSLTIVLICYIIALIISLIYFTKPRFYTGVFLFDKKLIAPFLLRQQDKVINGKGRILAVSGFTQKILKSVDFLFTSSKTLREILEINISYNKDDIFDETKKTVKEFQKVYKIPVVAMTIRKRNKLAALINSKSNNYLSEVYEVDQIDRVGAGDSFLGATMHGIISGWDFEKIISFSASSFAIAHTFKGDVNKFNDVQIQNFKNTNAC